MFTFEDIGFRPIEKRDLENLRQLHNEESTFLNLLNIDLVDEQSQEEWWSSLGKKQNDKRYAIVQKDAPGTLIGRLRIQNINWQHNNCEVGLDIFPELRGQGYGLKSYKMLLKYLFNHLNMQMVYLKVAAFNPNAKELYLKAGFTETGVLPQYFFRHGQYWDYCIMSITSDEYFKQSNS
jgi:RimJ/RimL family protein N-acetyltransferase